jgi:hypothetical protein
MQRTTKRSFVTSNRDTSDELRDWSFAREQIGRKLKTFYERCITDELPPRLREVLKKLENEELEPPEDTPKPSV